MDHTKETRQAGELCRGDKNAFGKQAQYSTLNRRLKIRELARIAEGHQAADYEILRQDALDEAERTNDHA